MDNTENFFQVRTFPIKLRQLLQAIGFLTPLELVHALVISDFNLKMTIKKLTKDGYSETEVKRVLQNAEKNILEPLNKNELSINDAFYKLSRRYFLLDCISYYGKDVTVSNKGIALIPGYGEYFGSKTSEVIGKVKKMGGKYYNDWQTPQILIEDLEFLAAKEWIMNI